jgi:hypothetical protein
MYTTIFFFRDDTDIPDCLDVYDEAQSNTEVCMWCHHHLIVKIEHVGQHI